MGDRGVWQEILIAVNKDVALVFVPTHTPPLEWMLPWIRQSVWKIHICATLLAAQQCFKE